MEKLHALTAVNNRYLQTSGALLVSRVAWKLSVSSGFALCLIAPQVSGCLASKIWGRQAACCLALPELAAYAGVETGRAARWSQAGTGSASSSYIRLHSYTSGDTQLQTERDRGRVVIPRGAKTPTSQKFITITADERKRKNLQT